MSDSDESRVDAARTISFHSVAQHPALQLGLCREFRMHGALSTKLLFLGNDSAGMDL